MEDHHDVDIEDVNLISGWNGLLDYGTSAHFDSLFRWVETADLTNEEDYAYFQTRVDLDCFIDYYILELFIENNDWPANNMRMWQEGDGPWRWIFYDGDACIRWMTFDACEQSVYGGDATWPSSTKSTLFFRKLLENSEFKQQFYGRFHELLNTVFDYSFTGVLYDQIKMALEPEISFQVARFGIPESVDAWNGSMGMVKYFLMNRVAEIEYILDDFLWDLPEYQQESLLCYPNPSSSEIHLSFNDDILGSTEITIYDMMGRKVFTQHCEIHQGQNDIVFQPNLKAGVYVLKMGRQVVKVVRQ